MFYMKQHALNLVEKQSIPPRLVHLNTRLAEWSSLFPWESSPPWGWVSPSADPTRQQKGTNLLSQESNLGLPVRSLVTILNYIAWTANLTTCRYVQNLRVE
jgi:hypothetical protein